MPTTRKKRTFLAGPDGPAEREVEANEQYRRDIADLDIAEALADESRDDPRTWADWGMES